MVSMRIGASQRAVVPISPILAVPGMRAALTAARAPVVAVSPVVGGEVLKGPTAAFLEWLGLPVSADGIAAHYGALLDGLLCDEACSATGIAVTQAPTLMSDPEGRRSVARAALELAETLRAQ